MTVMLFVKYAVVKINYVWSVRINGFLNLYGVHFVFKIFEILFKEILFNVINERACRFPLGAFGYFVVVKFIKCV
jgi:hypothetical protein